MNWPRFNPLLSVLKSIVFTKTESEGSLILIIDFGI